MTLLDVAENPQMIRKALGVCGAKPLKKERKGLHEEAKERNEVSA
jgi:hypothetical protein